MALLNDDLSVWEIGFRWAGLDPDSWRPGIPLAVRDNFRTLMDAILSGHLHCLTITLEKRGDDWEAPPLFHIRDDLDAVYECINGLRFKRKLLKWARVERWAFQAWCEGRDIPLPEFWFPPGWKLDYQWPEVGAAAPLPEAPPVAPTGEATDNPETGTPASKPRAADGGGATAPDTAEGAKENDPETKQNYRASQRACIACQEIAKNVWKADPGMTIAGMVEHEAIQQLGGGRYYVSEVVRRWLAEVAPTEVKARRGRPRKNPTPDE